MPQRALTATAGAEADALDPSVAYDSVRQRVMIAYTKQDPTLDGSEIFVRRFNAGLDAFAAEQRASTMGPPGATNFTAAEPSVTFLGGPDRYLVTWRGDNDFPGLVDNEIERWGQAFDAEGTELATDDFRISSAGPDRNSLNTVGAGAVGAAHPPTGRWLALYAADDGRPPLADNEFELYGRPIGENFDRDGDGSPVPADCNDGNAGIRPGAADVPDNGVDEDCSGADTINLDRDARRLAATGRLQRREPGDRARQAGHPEQQHRRGLLGLRAAGAHQRLDRALLPGVPRLHQGHETARDEGEEGHAGAAPVLSQEGQGLPEETARRRPHVQAQDSPAKNLTSLIKKARLKPGAMLEVRILETGAIGRLDKFKMRNGKLPKRTQRCIPHGQKKAQKCG